ncbi:3-oxoadipate enol-lactonase [Inquilinus limosus]|uniref:3-oxoadipate enol-lactonase n=1 Tax=Inquilinus limosus TaxID=171674 RepID=UPI000409CC48|nr:3-oxoadipate enol-lactonase [Inquilinus limosus]
MPHVTVDGCRLHYRLDGPEDGPPLLLSHALGVDLEMWGPQVERLARRFRVLRYDHRGHGGSNVPPGPYSLDRLGRDAVGLLDALGIGQADVVGLSLGGMVALWLGIHAPDRIGRLVPCCTTAYAGGPELWEPRIEAVRRDGMAALVDGVIGRWFSPGFRERAPQTVDGIRRKLLATPPDGYAATCAAIRDMDQRDAISRIRAPMLVLSGTQDQGTPPERGREIAAAVPGARFQALDAAHIANLEQADAFTAAVEGFLG